MNIEERASIMLGLEELVSEWLNYIDDFGNECAYTDSLIEQIKNNVKAL